MTIRISKNYVTIEKEISVSDFKSSYTEYKIPTRKFIERTINHTFKNYNIEDLVDLIFDLDSEWVWDIMEDENCNTFEELVSIHKQDNAIDTLIDIFGISEVAEELSKSKVFKEDIYEEFNAEVEKDFWENYEDYED